ncbi:MAG TPA: hypothetical protein EYP62_04945 [Kiritimatiellae bacterium]|nr:hypothetical protein [Kiritimatiellia bacterium]
MKENTAFLMVFLVLGAAGPALGWTSQEVDFPGDLQGWSLELNCTKYTGPDGSTEWFRYSFAAASNDSSYNFKMVTGNDWNNDYGGNTNFPKNQLDIMWYQPLFDTASMLAGGATGGFHYVFTVKNPGLTDTFISVMELSAAPAEISSVSGGTGSYPTNEAVVITIQLTTNPPPEQHVYVRYTTNGWTSWHMVPAAASGSTAYVTLSNLAGATTYEWYALTSTANSNYLAHTNSFAVDALTLSWDNDSGNNFHFGTPGEAAWMWHNNNRVIYNSTNAQIWVKIAYINGDGSAPWITNAAIYYVFGDTNTPSGSYGSPGNDQTHVALMHFDHIEQDSSDLGEAMWWVGNMTNLPYFTMIKYKIGAWYDTNHVEHFADYNTSGTNDAVFSFQLGHLGDPQLTVNGMNANYTTTKLFLDEAAGETQCITVVYRPGVTNLQRVEIFSNLDRRDYVDIDYTNQYISGDGYPDGIKPPDGNLISTNDTGAYFRAYPMTPVAPGEYVWTGLISRCGAYRLTARHQTNGMADTNWIWYTDWNADRRDHAIVVSPRKALDLTMYELNALTVEATAPSKAGRSTFRDLLGTNDVGGDDDAYDPFNLDYLNFLQVNCLWFQPIHPNGNERTEEDPDTGNAYDPGSPYATRDYFAVAPRFGSADTAQSAMEEFTNFVALCDSYTGSVGTINVMLDGVFNHTSWDAEMGQGGVDLGYTGNATNRIGAVRPSFYSLITDYGMPATYYVSAWSNDFATAPDRGDFGKWDDVTELYYGKYAALVRHNPEDNGNYLNEGDWYDYSDMTTNQMDLWRYFAYYCEYWIKKSGHPGSNTWTQSADDKGVDGLRCDFGQGLPPQAWEYIINHTRRIKWNFIFMAETLDGGIPGYRSNRHFDILNENLVFQFTQNHINDCWDIYNALEERRSTYNGGLILLNLTSHDEVLPDDDPWLVASRYGALASVDGIPMIFYGQEKGIKNYNTDYPTYDGFVYHELNFGKWIPHFKKWNQLTVWTSPPPDSTGLDQWYGRVNWARHYSPALRSRNRYFLKNINGSDNARIFAVAKYENAYGEPRTSDVVLAFALLLRHGEAHTGASDTYDLKPVWDLLGLQTGRLYNVCNLAASDAFAYVWPTNRTGPDLYDNGIWVDLPADTTGPMTNDGALVQYLKMVEINQAPQIDLPGPHTLPVGATTNFTVTASDPDGDTPTLTNTAAPSGASFVSNVFTWTAGSADCGTTNAVVFVADDQRGETNSVVTNLTWIVVPFDWDGDQMGDDWEWDNFSTLTNEAEGDYDGDGADNFTEYIAGTQPTNAASFFHISAVTNIAGETNRFTITVSTEPGKHYTLEFVDSLSNGASWSVFANTNIGVGTWLETGTVSSAYTFEDDFSTNTSGGAPAPGRRFYRVRVRNP